MRHELRGWGGLWALILVLGGVGVLGMAADPPGKTPPRDKGRPAEEEDTAPPKNKRLKNLDPDQVDAPSARPQDQAAGDLAQAARVERNKVVADLFEKLAVPHDVVVIRSSSREQRIKPIPIFPKEDAPPPSDLRITVLDPMDKFCGSLNGYKPYEKLAQEEVNKFLNRNLHQLVESDPQYCSRQRQLTAAELVLSVVARYHASARQLKEREGEGWSEVEASLGKALFGVRQQQLEGLVATGDWDQALTLGRRLWDTYLTEEDQARIAEPLARLLLQAVKDPRANREKMREVRQRLGELAGRYSNNKKFGEIGESLKKQAQELFNLARAAETRNENARAQDLLQQAEEIWPHLPDLRAHRQQVSSSYPILRVGVRQLPKFLSPGWATTDSELRAVELFFESLVKASPDGEGVVRYQPGLSHGRPQLLARGRQFQLPRNAFWSNNKPVTPADVRYTVRLLQKEGICTGLAPAWGELLEEARAENAFRVNVSMTQGYLEPLALMTFKILPQPSVVEKNKTAETEAFALNPVGSGPFQFDGEHTTKAGRKYLAFVANLNYGSRAGKANRPRIKEVQFFAYDNPLLELKNHGLLDMALDLTAEEVTALKQQAGTLRVKVPEPQPGNRRVYFLAVNHRNSVLQKAEVRLALAHGINREAILNLPEFRGFLGKKIHKALNSLYPADCWALDPKLHGPVDKDSPEHSLDLHDVLRAQTLAKQALSKSNQLKIALTLKYPDGDAQAEKAVEGIRNNVMTSTGIELKLEKCDPRQLRQDVEKMQHYELAYYHYDFPDDTYSLLPLLGPRGLSGGGNYLGYEHEQLTLELLKMRNLRDFVEVRDRARVIHMTLVTKEMPVIPLWQLDPLMAIHENLKTVPFDPWLVFPDIDQWKLGGP